MNRAVMILHDEHRSLVAVLKSLEKHVAEVIAGTTPTDYPFYSAMLAYLKTFPEILHHPKEDQFLFRRLRARCPSVNALLDELEEQHRIGALQLAALHTTLAAASAQDHIDAFAEALSAYAESQRAHIRVEEEQILPLAERELTTEDWAYVNAAFAVNRDSGW